MYLYVLILAPTRTIVLKTNEYTSLLASSGFTRIFIKFLPLGIIITLIFFDIEYFCMDYYRKSRSPCYYRVYG